MHKKRAIFFLLCVVFGFGVYKLTESPATWVDEGMIGQLAINLARHGVMGLQTSPGSFVSGAYISTGFPLVFPLAIVFKIAGVGILPARMLMLGWMLLLAAAAYIYINNVYGARAAFFAGLLLVTFAPLYGNGKNILGEVPGLFFLFLFLLAVRRYEKCASFCGHGLFFAGGLALGICMATKPVFLPLASACAAAYLWHRHDQGAGVAGSRIGLSGFLSMGAGVLMPLLVWIFTQFDRKDSVSGIFSFYRNPYALDHVGPAMLANALRFVSEISPAYTAGLFAVWAVSFFLRRRQGSDAPGLAERTALLFSFFVMVFYLRTPGWYRYFFPAQVLSLVHFPFSFDDLMKRIGRMGQMDMPRRYGVILICMGLTAFQAYQVGFSSWVAESYGSTRTRDLAAYFAAADPHKNIFVFNAPEIIIFLNGDTPYYQFLDGNKGIAFGANELAHIRLVPFADNVIVPVGDSGEYPRNFFPLYRLKERVNRYAVLEKR